MRRRLESVNSLLQCIHDATKRHKSNAYQIAKATGLPLRSVQKLLGQQSNPTLRNVETILNGFGMLLFIQDNGHRVIKPGKRALARKSDPPSGSGTPAVPAVTKAPRR